LAAKAPADRPERTTRVRRGRLRIGNVPAA
jgi:hypothetical protein